MKQVVTLYIRDGESSSYEVQKYLKDGFEISEGRDWMEGANYGGDGPVERVGTVVVLRKDDSE